MTAQQIKPQIIARVAGATVISHGTNKGYGEAIKSCFAAGQSSEADILVTIDGDGRHNPDEIPLLLDSISTENTDLVIGSRFLSNEKVPLYRKFGIGVINFLWNIGSGTKISDTQSGFRAYSREVLNNLKCSDTGMSVSIEILEKIRKKKPIIKEVPITCSYHNNNSSLSIKAIRHGIDVSYSVIRIRLKNIFK